MKLKHILIAAFSPLIVLSLGVCVYQSLKRGHPDFIGIIYGIYYFIPVAVFTLTYAELLKWSGKLNVGLLSSMIAQLTLSLLLALMLLTLWVLFDGSMHHYFGKRFFTHLTLELKRFWMIVVYFGLSVPILLRLSMKRER
jgi:hypothetical protein